MAGQAASLEQVIGFFHLPNGASRQPARPALVAAD